MHIRALEKLPEEGQPREDDQGRDGCKRCKQDTGSERGLGANLDLK